MQSHLYKLSFLALSFFMCVMAQQTFAHESGPSYIFVNGKNTTLNVVRGFAHSPGFTLGTDLAPENSYLAGTPIAFKIDEKNFYTPNNAKAQFQWDFQDGTPKDDGAGVVHTFQNPRTYFINLYARHDVNIPYTNADIVQINIVASTNTVIPVAKIMANGKLITNFNQKESIPPHTKIQFDASQSVGNNLRFYWEFGDGTRSRDKVALHTYSGSGESTFFPVLRITDDQNIVSDSIITLESSTLTPTPKSSSGFIFNFLSSIWKFLTTRRILAPPLKL